MAEVKKTAAVKAAEPVKEVVKKEAVKAEPAKKTIEKKATEEKVVEKKPVEKKVAEKKVAEKKTAEKKTTTKKAVKKATEEVQVVVQFNNRSVVTKELVERIKELYVSDGKKASDIKTLDIYMNMAEARAYYVVNGESAGSVEF
ncbi:MAG: DUF6465 family protein [Lachnospiraceae bacterium]